MKRGFEFGGIEFELAGDTALYWPSQAALLLSDLHLEKASAYAAGGQMLPPYDSLSTLEHISDLVAEFRPEMVISLGDNFHDSDGEHRLDGDAADILQRLTRSTRWLWITGNHDPEIGGKWGGQSIAETKIDSMILRHQAKAGEELPEISGHFHPKFRRVIKGRMVSRRCFVKCRRKLIMPAFGALTGGLDVSDNAIVHACDLQHSEIAEALVPMRDGLARFQIEKIST